MKKQVERWLKTVYFRRYGDRPIRIKDIELSVDHTDAGGRAYNARSSHEEYVSPLYDRIASDLDPRLIVDVGANYGFTGLVFAKRFPKARVVLVEPSPRLCRFIRRNFQGNKQTKAQIVQAICGASEDENSRFAMNPASSQDNRVIGQAGWKCIDVPTVSLAKLIEDAGIEGNVFVKIDTQGFEERVFEGAKPFLLGNDNWLIKTEFAPQWLESQGTRPQVFLESLIENFSVVEAPARTRFKGDTLDSLFANPLAAGDAKSFVSYVTSLDKDHRGWCDLLVKPGT